MADTSKPPEASGNDGLYRLLIDAVTDYAIYMLDPSGNVASWNPGAERLKGYSEAEIIGSHFSRFYCAEDLEVGLPAQALQSARSTGRFEHEGWRLRKDNSRFWAHVVIKPIVGDAAELLGFAKVTRDLTERYESQRALDAAREALFHSQKTEALGRLTGGVAHDFNNLLAVITLSLTSARKRLPAGSPALQMIDHAAQSAERGVTMTRRMLAFARRQELKLEQVDLAELVQGMDTLLQQSLGPAINVRQQIASNLPPVMVDAHQLESALLNLAVNARDAMPGGGTLTITIEHRMGVGSAEASQPDSYVSLAVSDTGEGMNEQTLARATEPFFTTKGVGKGTGLGLSMVQGLAEQLGGRFFLRSAVHGGTTAELWLPCATEQDLLAVEPLVADTVPPSASLRILLVDDDPLVLASTEILLTDLQHRVLAASDGHKALDILADNPVDLVVTDYAMPGMTGEELGSAIVARWPDTPVIIASGYVESSDPGAFRRLAKPFSEEELVAVLSNYPPRI